MKKFLYLLIFFTTIACNINNQSAKNIIDSSNKPQQLVDTSRSIEQQQKSVKNTIEEEKLVTDFYTYYVASSLKEEKERYDFLKDAKLKKYISKQKLDEIKKEVVGEDGLNVDPFLQAQDVFPEWKNIFIKEAKKVDEIHTEIKIKLGNDKNICNLKAIVVKQNGVWVIDKVDNE